MKYLKIHIHRLVLLAVYLNFKMGSFGKMITEEVSAKLLVWMEN